MKKLIYSLVLASSVLCIGCRQEERDPLEELREDLRKAAVRKAAEEAARVPASSEYRALLERRKTSVDGANINILQEVSKFENATDEEKRKLYDQAKAFVK